MPFTVDPRVIYRGTGASLLNEMQMMGVQFGINGFLARTYWAWRLNESVSGEGGEGRKVNPAEEIGVASVAGMISAFTTSPVELVMINQQRYGGSIAAQLGSVIKEGGMFSRGIGRGMGCAILRDGIYVAGLLGITPTLQTHLIRKGHSEATSGLYASIVGGCVAAVLSHPLDMVKTCMQGDMKQTKYQDTISTVRALTAEGGFSRLYHGLFWRTVNIVGTVYIANEVRVWATQYLDGRRAGERK